MICGNTFGTAMIAKADNPRVQSDGGGRHADIKRR